MNKMKFYAGLLLLGAVTFTFSSCGDEEEELENSGYVDNNDSDNGNGSEENKPNGSIIGTWVLNENKSVSSFESKELDEFIKNNPTLPISEDMIKEFSGALSDILGSTTIFKEDGVVIMKDQDGSEETGTYKTQDPQLEITLKDENGKDFTIKAGSDLSSLISDEEGGMGANISAKVDKLQYSVSGDVLTITIVNSGSANLKALMGSVIGGEDSGMDLGFDLSLILGMLTNVPENLNYTQMAVLVFDRSK